MGYIYLQPQHLLPKDPKVYNNDLFKYVTPEEIIIPYSTNENISASFDSMTIAKNTFRKEQDASYDTEYGNDLDQHGYVVGIELTLTSETFIKQIKEQHFQLIKTQWKDKPFHLVTFDHINNVLQPTNKLYKLTDSGDAFVIVHLHQSEKLGSVHLGASPNPPIAVFKGLLTANEDVYPLEYLKNPDFFLIEGKPEVIDHFSFEEWEELMTKKG